MKRTLLLLILSLNVFAAGRELAPGVYGPAALNAGDPLVAFAGGKFLTVWREHVGGRMRIAGAFSDARGQRLSRRSFVVPSDGNPVKLIAAGDSFALFTDDGTLVFIDGNGHATPGHLGGIQPRGTIDAAWNNGHFLITSSGWFLHGYQHALLLDRDGTILRNGIRLTPFTTSSSLVPLGDSFARVAVRDAKLFTERIAINGSVVRSEVEPLAGNAIAGPCARDCVALSWVAYDGTIRAATLGADGTLSAVQTFTPFYAALDVVFRPVHVLKSDDGITVVVNTVSPREPTPLLQILKANNPVIIESTYSPAAASTGDVILVTDTTSAGVRGLVIDRGLHVGTEILAISKVHQAQPVLGSSSGRAVAVFTEWVATTPRVRATTIDADGTPLEHRVVAEDAMLASSDLSWNGSEFLTVIWRDNELRVLRLDANGEPIPGNLPMLTRNAWAPVRASVAWAGDRWLVAWPNGPRLMLATLTSNAIVSSVRALDLPPLPPEWSAHYATDVAIAFDGAQGILGWIERRTPRCNIGCVETPFAFSTRIRRNATRLDGVVQRITGPYPNTVSAAAGDGEFTAVADADVAFDGTGFVTATRDAQELVVSRPGSARGTLIQPAETAEPPSIVAIGGNVVIGIQESDPMEGGRATVYVERELPDS